MRPHLEKMRIHFTPGQECVNRLKTGISFTSPYNTSRLKGLAAERNGRGRRSRRDGT